MHASPHKAPWPWWIIWILATWWLSRHFSGPSDHDGIFYSGEAFRRLMPDNFANDIFFQGATQGNYSVFGWVYAQLVALSGLYPAALWMSLGGRLLWAIGAYTLAASLTRDRLHHSPFHHGMALALIMLLPSAYDGMGFFKFGEAVVSSRNWAEGFILLAVAQAIGGRQWAAWLLAGTAMAFHPLMALPGMVIVWSLYAPRWRNAVGIIGVLLILAAGLSGLDPFQRLFMTFDTAWWQVVSNRNAYITLATWPLPRITSILAMLVLCGYVARVEKTPVFRRLAKAIGLLILLDLCLWILGIYFRNVLLTQLQLWRVLWLGQLLVPALWVRTLRPWASWQTPDWIHVLMVMAALIGLSWSIHLCMVLGLSVTHPKIRTFLRTRPPLARACVLASVAALLLTLPAIYPDIIIHLFLFSQTSAAFPALFALCQEPIVTLPTLACLAWLTTKLPFRITARAAIACGLAGCSLYTVFHQWQEAREPLPNVQSIQALIPPGAVVYWDQGLIHTWLILNRASYASFQQGSSAVFSRDLAIEMTRRMNFLGAMGIQEGGGRQISIATEPNFSGLCRDSTLDFVLMQGDHPGATHKIPHPYAPYTDPTLSIFDCAQLRRASAPSPLPLN